MSDTVHYHLGKFPPGNVDWPRLIPLMGQANRALARFASIMSVVPNSSVLLSPLSTQEAVLSSKIEGTRVTMGEVLELEAGGEPANFSQPRRDDAEEIINYRSTLAFCAKALEARPLSQHLIREAHSMLMRGVRGREMEPGKYRLVQNWIGASGCSLDKASFVPIAPEQLQTGMDAWNDYLNSETEPDLLVQLAVIHAEFESLHPFKDGNGRLGRMLIPLFLYQRNLLNGPYFYMSGFLESNREEYQTLLRNVSRHNDWTTWSAFFLRGITFQAEDNERKALAIFDLYEKMKTRAVELTKSHHSIKAVDFIFQNPIFASPHFTNNSQIPKPTASRILHAFRKGGVLYPLVEGKAGRTGIYSFTELMRIADDR